MVNAVLDAAYCNVQTSASCADCLNPKIVAVLSIRCGLRFHAAFHKCCCNFAVSGVVGQFGTGRNCYFRYLVAACFHGYIFAGITGERTLSVYINCKQLCFYAVDNGIDAGGICCSFGAANAVNAPSTCPGLCIPIL